MAAVTMTHAQFTIPTVDDWGYYNPNTDTILLSPKASEWTKVHEECHRDWYKNLTTQQRQRWATRFTQQMPWCYSMYPFSLADTAEISKECFAEVCAHAKNTTLPKVPWKNQPWKGDIHKTYQYNFVMNALRIQHKTK